MSNEFVVRIDNGLQGLAASPLTFPEYRSGDEAVWLQNVPQELPEQYICLDGQLVRLEGETPFEAADLVHVSGALVHAKRKARSSALAYAMVQARRSCQMLSSVQEAREQLERFVREAARTKAVADEVVTSLKRLEQTPPALSAVLAILGKEPKRGLPGLPLLAKAELVETARQIGQLGFEFSVVFVGLA